MNKRVFLVIPIVLIIIIIGMLVIKYIKSGKSDVKIENGTSISINDDRILKLVDESYKYYLLKEGPIVVDKNKSITADGNEYFLVVDDEFNNMADIDNMINDVYYSTYVTKMRDELVNGNRKYIENDNQLYVYNADNSCEVNYDLSKASYSHEFEEGLIKLTFELDDSHYYEYKLYNEEGIYKVISPLYKCNLNIIDDIGN